MVQLVVFINLFFVPLLPLYILYRKKSKPLEPNLDLLFQYGIVAVCNIPLTKIVVFSIRKIGGAFISIDSGYYTVVALLPTILGVLGYRFYTMSFARNNQEEVLRQSSESEEMPYVSRKIKLAGNPYATLLILTELFIMFLMSFPRLDDWTWGSSVGMDRLSRWFAGYNGRYVGNLIVIALTRLPAGVRACLELTILCMLFYYAHRLLPKKGTFCFFVLSLLCLPLPIFAQSVVWTAGFANYTTSATVMLFVMSTYYRVVIRGDTLSRTGHVVFLVVTFLGQLILENTTIFVVVLALGSLIFGLIKNRKVPVPVATGLFSALGGAALMFSNSSYHSALVGDGGTYKSIILMPLELFEKYTDGIVPHLVQNNHILNLALTIVLALLWLTRNSDDKTGRHAWSSKLGSLCGIVLIAFFAYDMVEDTWTQAYSWGKNVFAIISLVYAVYIIATITVAVDQKEDKPLLLLLAMSQVVLAVPLVPASPLHVRCFFQNGILWAMLLGSMLQVLMERFGVDFDHTEKNRFSSKVLRITQVICICYLAFMLCGQSQSWHIQSIRQEITQSAIESGAETIVLPQVPYSEIYSHGANISNSNDTWLKNYKRYYNIPMEIKLEFMDYYKWLKAYGGD